MKKFIIAIAALSMTAVSSEAQVRFGVIAGANLSSPAYKIQTSGVDIKSKLAPGFYVGGIVDIGISKFLSVQPGLNFSVKPGHFDFDAGVLGDADSKIAPSYVELPVNIVGKFDAGPGQVLVNVGPYIAYGVMGKLKVESNSPFVLEDEDRDIEWGDDETEDDLKPLDVGANIGVGYQLSNGLFINLGYQRGFTNLFPGGDSDYKYNTNLFRVGAGFIF